MEEVSGAAAFLGRAEEVVPPSELVTRIAYLAPIGRTRHPLEHQGFLSRMATKWLQPILQPRLAMGMAMTVLSFAMLQRCTGIQVQHIQPADLNPVRIWDGVEEKAMRVKDRTVKYYENIRLVYEIESRLKDLEAQQADTPDDSAQKGSARPNGQRDQKTNGAQAPNGDQK
jgi:hypothetical protein